jgi:hypothetical protein
MRSIRMAIAAGIGAGLLATAMHAQDSPVVQKQPLPPGAQGPPRTIFIGTPPPSWGTTAESWYHLGAAELHPDTSETLYSSTWFPEFAQYSYQRWVKGGYPHLIGFAHVPGGSTLDTWQFSYCDSNSVPPHMTINLYACDLYGACTSPPVVSFDTGSVPPGCNSTTIGGGSLGFTVNNYSGEYLVDVAFGVSDGTQTFGGTAFGYRLQVSPAPGSATFNDVPLSDPAFQYVEALVASGITAGCGGGNFCPDNPLTRRQMAVFLAKALGLNWPDH